MRKKLLLFDLDGTLFRRLPDDFREEDFLSITVYPGVKEVLTLDNCWKVLISKGEENLQLRKVGQLGIKHFFDRIYICTVDETKKNCFVEAIRQFPSEEVWVIGDRIDSEIKFGNQLGLKTVQLRQGKYKHLKPRDESEMAQFQISEFIDLMNVDGF